MKAHLVCLAMIETSLEADRCLSVVAPADADAVVAVGSPLKHVVETEGKMW